MVVVLGQEGDMDLLSTLLSLKKESGFCGTADVIFSNGFP